MVVPFQKGRELLSKKKRKRKVGSSEASSANPTSEIRLRDRSPWVIPRNKSPRSGDYSHTRHAHQANKPMTRLVSKTSVAPRPKRSQIRPPLGKNSVDFPKFIPWLLWVHTCVQQFSVTTCFQPNEDVSLCNLFPLKHQW